MKNKMSKEGFVSLIKIKKILLPFWHFFMASLLLVQKSLFGKSVGLVGEWL